MKSIATKILKIQTKLGSLTKSVRKTDTNWKSFYSYVPLEDVLEKVLPAFQEEKLLLMQPPISKEGAIGVKTIIVDTQNGESLEWEFMLPLSKQDAQAGGSAITYARRYAIVSILSLITENDDDGQKTIETGGTTNYQPNFKIKQ